ncbi:MAG: hypothetical protein LBM27_02085 [Lactobacillaceae bacterium]|jgi:hypothetical protein|nr:hypothetical protein [Lactobacillaceae bacterium]
MAALGIFGFILVIAIWASMIKIFNWYISVFLPGATLNIQELRKKNFSNINSFGSGQSSSTGTKQDTNNYFSGSPASNQSTTTSPNTQQNTTYMYGQGGGMKFGSDNFSNYTQGGYSTGPSNFKTYSDGSSKTTSGNLETIRTPDGRTITGVITGNLTTYSDGSTKISNGSSNFISGGNKKDNWKKY